MKNIGDEEIDQYHNRFSWNVPEKYSISYICDGIKKTANNTSKL